MITTELQSIANILTVRKELKEQSSEGLSIDAQIAKAEAETELIEEANRRLTKLIELAEALPDKPTTNDQIKAITTEVNDFCDLMGC